MKILLAAEEAAGVQTLRAIAQSGHRIAGVMTAAVDEPRRATGVRDLARQLGYDVWPARWVREPAFADRIRAEGVDLLLNVHSLYLVDERVLEAPRLGSYNLHPGPLPQYAGLNVVSWALYRGETRHGVTIHRMVPRVDAGSIAYQAEVDIAEQDTALTLSVKCVQAGVPLLKRLVETAARDPATIPAAPQALARRRYFGRTVPQGGRVVWGRPARDVVNFVRACDYLPFTSPWGHPKGCVDGREVAILKATLLDEPVTVPPGVVGAPVGRAVKVAAGDRWVLVHRLQLGGGEAFRDAGELLHAGQRFERGGEGEP